MSDQWKFGRERRSLWSDAMQVDPNAFGATHPLESEAAQGGYEWVWGSPAADPPNVRSFRLGLTYHVDAGMNIDIEGQPVTYEEWQSVRYWWDRYAAKEGT